MAKTYDVKVKAPPREGFSGYWSGQKFWPSGPSSTAATVTGAELRHLLDDDSRGYLMVEDASSLRDQLEEESPTAASSDVGAPVLPPDELAVLEEFRRKKLADQQAATLKAKQDADAKAQADAAAAAGKKGGK